MKTSAVAGVFVLYGKTEFWVVDGRVAELVAKTFS